MLALKTLPTEADKAPASRPTPREVVERLDLLGSSQAVADFFATQGITGYRICPNDCPVARYVERETGGHHRVYGGLGLPPNVRDFIADFDRQRYPHLVVKGRNCRCRVAPLPF